MIKSYLVKELYQYEGDEEHEGEGFEDATFVHASGWKDAVRRACEDISEIESSSQYRIKRIETGEERTYSWVRQIIEEVIEVPHTRKVPEST